MLKSKVMCRGQASGGADRRVHLQPGEGGDTAHVPGCEPLGIASTSFFRFTSFLLGLAGLHMTDAYESIITNAEIAVPKQ